MTDEEIICEWMEAKPTHVVPPSIERPVFSRHRWWLAGLRPHREWDEWYPCTLTLGRLHDVESRLTAEQWVEYENLAMSWWNGARRTAWQAVVHASADQKIRALAEVITAGVEGV